MSATDYSVDLRDIRFILHEQLKVTETLGRFERFADFDAGMVDQMVEEAVKIATEAIAPTNKIGDREGVKFDGEGNVTTPESFKPVWKLVAEGGWLALTADPELGGMGAPQAVGTAAADAMTGANVSFATYWELARGAANLLAAHSADTWWGRLAAEKLYAGEWGGTMCLTEPGAGSDVGANRTRATPTEEPGVYTLQGEKIFITGGDHDLTENIIHLVLARTPDAPAGTHGLSLFMVPKFLFDENGELGERNDIVVESIEEKMGIHASATTTLSIGGRGTCKGWLIGEEFEGIKVMFHMMNEARIGVGLQGIAGASAAYRNAVAYAKERLQGSDLDDIGDDEAPSVPIIRHPDVRRMLLWQKVLVDGMRSLIYDTACQMDIAAASDDPAAASEAMGFVELMTPILKAFCSDKGFECTVQAMQVFGGYGYTAEYPVEQHVRDTKISSIYEGTNGIQAMDLLGRKMRRGNGVLFMSWLNRVNAEVDRCAGIEELAPVVAAFEKARDALGGAAMHLGALAMQGQLKAAMLQATPFLELFGYVALGHQHLWQARVAHEALQGEVSDSDRKFYRAKVLGARFYAAEFLPKAVAIGKSIRSGDLSCMDEDLFET